MVFREERKKLILEMRSKQADAMIVFRDGMWFLEKITRPKEPAAAVRWDAKVRLLHVLGYVDEWLSAAWRARTDIPEDQYPFLFLGQGFHVVDPTVWVLPCGAYIHVPRPIVSWTDLNGAASPLYPAKKFEVVPYEVVMAPPPNPYSCLLYTSPSPRDGLLSRMPSSA